MILDELRHQLETKGKLTLLFVDEQGRWNFYRGELVGHNIVEYRDFIKLDGAAPAIVAMAAIAKQQIKVNKPGGQG